MAFKRSAVRSRISPPLFKFFALFAISTMEYGGIAQLGERLNGIQEVCGSIPHISTKSLKLFNFGLFFVFMDL